MEGMNSMRIASLCKKIVLFILICSMPVVLAGPKTIEKKVIDDCANGTKIVVLNYHKIDDKNIFIHVDSFLYL